MTEIKKEQLKEKITGLEASLESLQKQLSELEQKEQHAMIEHIDFNLNTMSTHCANLQEFWQSIKEEIEEIFLRKNIK